jgi:hypothetical protein
MEDTQHKSVVVPYQSAFYYDEIMMMIRDVYLMSVCVNVKKIWS